MKKVGEDSSKLKVCGKDPICPGTVIFYMLCVREGITLHSSQYAGFPLRPVAAIRLFPEINNKDL